MPAGSNLVSWEITDPLSPTFNLLITKSNILWRVRSGTHVLKLPIVRIIFCVVARLTGWSAGQILDWEVFSCLMQGAFTPRKPKRREKKALIHAPARRQKTVKRDLKRNPLWPPRCYTARNLWKEASRYWSVRLIADFHCLVRRYWKPIYKAFIWRADVGGPVSFVNTVPRYFDWRLKQLVKVWMTPLISLRR